MPHRRWSICSGRDAQRLIDDRRPIPARHSRVNPRASHSSDTRDNCSATEIRLGVACPLLLCDKLWRNFYRWDNNNNNCNIAYICIDGTMRGLARREDTAESHENRRTKKNTFEWRRKKRVGMRARRRWKKFNIIFVLLLCTAARRVVGTGQLRGTLCIDIGT